MSEPPRPHGRGGSLRTEFNPAFAGSAVEASGGQNRPGGGAGVGRPCAGGVFGVGSAVVRRVRAEPLLNVHLGLNVNFSAGVHLARQVSVEARARSGSGCWTTPWVGTAAPSLRALVTSPRTQPALAQAPPGSPLSPLSAQLEKLLTSRLIGVAASAWLTGHPPLAPSAASANS